MRVRHWLLGWVGFGWEPADMGTRQMFGVIGLLRLGIVALAFHLSRERWNELNKVRGE